MTAHADHRQRTMIVVAGLPGSGKSTLTNGLVQALTNAQRIAIGDELRRMRASGVGWNARMESAFLGEIIFDICDIARVLRESLTRVKNSGPIVVDGGVGIADALVEVGIRPTLAINLTTRNEVRLERLAQRAASGYRIDDNRFIHAERSAIQSGPAERTVRKLAMIAPTLSIDGEAEKADVLKSTLSALLLTRIPDDTGVCTDWAFGEPVPPSEASRLAPGPVFLIKPHLAKSSKMLDTVRNRFNMYGWDFAWEKCYLTGTPGVAARARAHFDAHYLYAAHASVLLGPNHVGGLEVGSTECRIWERERVWKTERGYWRTDSQTDGSVLVNGHMPQQLSWYEKPGHVVLALGIRPARSDHAGWATLRHEVLGASDPAKALPTSLRGQGAREQYTSVPFTLQKNGFHMSAGPLEAVRETMIWSGGLTSAALAYAVDQTPRGEAAWFHASEGQSWGMKSVVKVLQSAWALGRSTALD